MPKSQLPPGVRQDTRKHTRHVLAPPAALVVRYLARPTAAAWKTYAAAYRRVLDQRYVARRDEFDALAELARRDRVHIGCSCPTKRNPDVTRCHTWLALEFMQEKYPDLDVRLPGTVKNGHNAPSPHRRASRHQSIRPRRTKKWLPHPAVRCTEVEIITVPSAMCRYCPRGWR